MECKQVGITGDNVCRAPAYGEFQKLVVLRVTASFDSNIGLNPLRFARESCQEHPNVLFVDISSYPPSAQNIVQFGENFEGK